MARLILKSLFLKPTHSGMTSSIRNSPPAYAGVRPVASSGTTLILKRERCRSAAPYTKRREADLRLAKRKPGGDGAKFYSRRVRRMSFEKGNGKLSANGFSPTYSGRNDLSPPTRPTAAEISAARGWDCGEYCELFLLELTTGLRRGEVLALQWDDLDFKTGALRIQRQVYRANGDLVVSAPKTKAALRTIVLPPALLGVLEEYRLVLFSWEGGALWSSPFHCFHPLVSAYGSEYGSEL